MVFSSLTFLYLFLPIVLFVYYVIPKKMKNLFILLSGLFFYAWGEPIYVIIMIISTLIDYTAGRVMHKFDDKISIRRLALIVSVVMNISLLACFKYSDFIIVNINSLTGADITNPIAQFINWAIGSVNDLTGLKITNIDVSANLPLPIGISFFTFQSMSYTIDLYLRKIKVQRNVIDFAAFVTLFPQIVAGPIVRYDDIAAELKNRTVNLDTLYDGIIIFVTGLGKKVLIANNIGAMWTAVKAMELTGMSVLTAWLGIIAFTFQIYFDFSGYSDMAIGLGKMMGFNFPKNFDYPYLSKSISEFWRRWHMTLGGWFKSYVYFPLGGSKKGKGRTIFNLAVVWFLTGMWHGASWNFILWGCFYGLIIIMEKLFLGKLLDKIPSFLRIIYTMLLVIIGWVLFDTADLSTALAYIGTMFGSTGVLIDNQGAYLLLNYGLMIAICYFACTDAWKNLVEFAEKKVPMFVHYSTPIVKTVIMLLSTAYLVDATYNPFLYFNF